MRMRVSLFHSSPSHWNSSRLALPSRRMDPSGGASQFTVPRRLEPRPISIRSLSKTHMLKNLATLTPSLHSLSYALSRTCLPVMFPLLLLDVLNVYGLRLHSPIFGLEMYFHSLEWYRGGQKIQYVLQPTPLCASLAWQASQVISQNDPLALQALVIIAWTRHGFFFRIQYQSYHPRDLRGLW
jgi:hypothetical protein